MPATGEAVLALGNALHPAVRRIVTDALARGVGSPLPTNAHYLQTYGIGAGTIQRALTLLEDREVLQTSSHGHRGRTIDTIDVGQAWQAGGLPPVRLLLPPSGPAEIDVLDRLLAEGLTNLGIPHTVHHRRGGGRRLASVRSGEHDIALISAGVSAEDVVPETDPRPAAADRGSPLTRMLAPGTYYAPGRLVAVRRTDSRAMAPARIGIDSQSSDHVALTTGEYPESAGVSYVEIRFPSIPAAVLRGEVDAGIWHLQRSFIPLDLAGLSTARLTRQAATEVWDRLSAAVLVGWEGRPELAAVLASMPLDDVAAQQTDAMRGDADLRDVDD